MKLYIKNKKRKPGEFQFFMHQFVEAGIKKGIQPLPEFASHNLFIRIIRRLSPLLRFLSPKKKSIIIPSDGSRLFHFSKPYFRYNIIPFLWDVWPGNKDKLCNDIKRLNVKIAFVTSKQNKDLIETATDIKCYYIPEGIDISDYSKGEDLIKRKGEVYELGRQHPLYHKTIISLIRKGTIKQYYGNEYDEQGQTARLAFSTADELLQKLNKIKIVICFPQCDTHPQRAGKIETLTQRYWECMLSGNLMVGRAPQELIELIGYNPVVNIDWDTPEKQLSSILQNIETYQSLVDKNYDIALKYASWDHRIEQIEDILRSYEIKK